MKKVEKINLSSVSILEIDQMKQIRGGSLPGASCQPGETLYFCYITLANGTLDGLACGTSPADTVEKACRYHNQFLDPKEQCAGSCKPR